MKDESLKVDSQIPEEETKKKYYTSILSKVSTLSKQQLYIISAVVIILLLGVTGLLLPMKKTQVNDLVPTISPTVSEIISPTITLNPTISQVMQQRNSSTSTPIPVQPTVYKTPTSIPPTATSVPPTATPRPANPPQINISYPIDGQSITMDSSQTFCVVDSPSGGDTTGIQRKQNINNAGWTDYQSMSTLCYSPNDGANTLQLQYKNQNGEESGVYSINFTFQRTN